MNTTIPYTQLQSLFQNHRTNPGLPFMTNSVVIDLLQLDKFVMQAKNTKNCDAIKIYFIRYPLTADALHIKKTPANNLSQISLAIVPANITFYFGDWIAEDLPDGANNILTLLVCDPTYPRDKHDKTSLCPPKGVCT